MKKITTSIFTSLFFIFASYSQEVAIDKNTLKELRSSIKQSSYFKAISNSVSNQNIKKLAKNRKNVAAFDYHFKHKVKTSGISSQNQAGICWMFTGLNCMKPKALTTLNIANFEFSSNYLFFYDQLEKSNLFLQEIINTRNFKTNDRKVEWLFRHPISDGGVWNLFVDLVEKYGLMPKQAMPNTQNSKNSSMMNKILKRKLKEFALELREMSGKEKTELQTRKTEMLKDIYKILTISLGEPPEEFTYRYKNKDGELVSLENYTPKQFAKKIIDVDLNEYVLFMDNPTREYYKLYEIEYDRNLIEGNNWKFVNLPADKFKEFAKESIKANEAMYFSCDVGKFMDRETGILDTENYDYESLFDMKFSMNKTQRIKTFESGSTHGMALIGVDTDKNGKITKWLLENSWGASSGHNGYLIMTDRWFDEYMFRIVMNKKFVSDEILKILKKEAILLPPWDPMFIFDK